MLKPFRCPTTDRAWAEADQELAALVVPAVFNASSIEEKHKALSKGIYNYFSKKYGTRAAGKRTKGKRSNTDLAALEEAKKERNKARNDLRRAKRQGVTSASIKALASHFHQLLCHHRQLSRLQGKVLSKANAQRERKDCAKHFNKFAKAVLDGDKSSQEIDPAFDAHTAHEHFQTVLTKRP